MSNRNSLCHIWLCFIRAARGHVQVGSKRGRSPEADPAARLMLDAEGKPRKRLRISYPAPQFLTIYNHRQTLKQRCAKSPLTPDPWLVLAVQDKCVGRL